MTTKKSTKDTKKKTTSKKRPISPVGGGREGGLLSSISTAKGQVMR